LSLTDAFTRNPEKEAEGAFSYDGCTDPARKKKRTILDKSWGTNGSAIRGLDAVCIREPGESQPYIPWMRLVSLNEKRTKSTCKAVLLLTFNVNLKMI